MTEAMIRLAIAVVVVSLAYLCIPLETPAILRFVDAVFISSVAAVAYVAWDLRCNPRYKRC